MVSATAPRAALVTGASRGIGLGIARRLAERGYALSIAARGAEALHAHVDDLCGRGAAEVLVAAGDMSDPSAVREIVSAHRRRFGRMDVLVANAGVGTAGPIASSSIRRFDKTIAVNLRAPLLLMQSALPMLRAAARENPTVGARVVVLSSITGVYAEPKLAVYGSTKAALLSLVETFNAEEAGQGVVATAIAPGFVDTDMSAWAQGEIAPERMLPVDDVVSVVDMLVSLSPRTMISRVVMARSGTSGFRA